MEGHSVEQLKERRAACGNKQVVIGKKNKHANKKIKNNIENGRSVGHESRYCYTSQADRF